MILQPTYADTFSPAALPGANDEAVMGLQASLRSSAALRAILETARERGRKNKVPHTRMRTIEQICVRYEDHHKAVRDHCLDYYNTRPEVRVATNLEGRTSELLKAGRDLYQQLRETILQF